MTLTKRRAVLAALFVVALAMSGCKIRQSVVFNEDGSGTFTYLVGVDKDILDDLGVVDPYESVRQQVEDGDFPVELERYETPDLRGFRLSLDFKSVDDLKEKLNVGEEVQEEGQQTIQQLELERGGERWDLSGAVGVPDLGTDAEVPFDVSKVEERLEMVFTIAMPGVAGATNADTVREGDDTTTFVWSLTPGQAGRDIVATTELPSGFPVPIVVGAVVGALVLVGAVWALRLRRAQPLPHDQEAATGDGLA